MCVLYTKIISEGSASTVSANKPGDFVLIFYPNNRRTIIPDEMIIRKKTIPPIHSELISHLRKLAVGG